MSNAKDKMSGYVKPNNTTRNSNEKVEKTDHGWKVGGVNTGSLTATKGYITRNGK